MKSRAARQGDRRETDLEARIEGRMSLELRPNCECCDRDLPPDAPVADRRESGAGSRPRNPAVR